MPTITKRFVDTAGPGRHYDDKLAGFGLFVGASGTRSYFVEYRPGRGRTVAKRRATIGRHGVVGPGGRSWTPDTAREEAIRFLGMVKSGRDPLAEREAARVKAETDLAGTVRAVCTRWLAADQSGNRTRGTVRRAMERDVLPVIGDKQIDAVQKVDVLALIDRVHARAPVNANRVLAHVKRMFRWAAGRDIIRYDPVRDIEKPTVELSRDRVLDDAELVAVWRAAERAGGPLGDGVRLLVLTGARLSEIYGSRWDEVEHDGDVPVALRLPAERAKNGAGRRIWLSPLAAAIVAGRPRFASGTHLLSVDGRRPFIPDGRARVRLAGRAAAELGRELAPWRLHDLRRTVATGLQRLGVRLEATEAVLGHISGSRTGIVGVYQRHRFEEEARTALAAWGEHVRLLVEGVMSRGTVVPLRRPA